MLGDLIARLWAAHLTAGAAIADTLGAHAVARFGEAESIAIVPSNAITEALAPLPVAALRIDPEIAAELHRFGLKRIEQLLASSRAPLVLRFGETLIRRLDQALGQAAEPVASHVPERTARRAAPWDKGPGQLRSQGGRELAGRTREIAREAVSRRSQPDRSRQYLQPPSLGYIVWSLPVLGPDVTNAAGSRIGFNSEGSLGRRTRPSNMAPSEMARVW